MLSVGRGTNAVLVHCIFLSEFLKFEILALSRNLCLAIVSEIKR